MSVKKSIIITLALCVAVLSVASARTIKEATESPKSGLTVVLDAGHGGIDGGVTGVKTGVKESELNLKIVKELKTRLEKAGVKTVLTRTTDAGLYGNATDGFKRRDMLARKKIINGCNADAFVSVHINYYSSPSRRGAQAFFRENDELCETFAAVMQKNLNTLGGQPRLLSALKGDYYVLNESEPPATLVECGFLSNEEDEALLLSENYRAELAEKISIGILEFLYVGQQSADSQ